jgi:hypothetical protein
MLASKDRRVVISAAAFIELVPLSVVGRFLWDASLYSLQEGYDGDTALIAASDVQTLVDASDHSTSKNAGELSVLSAGTKCWWWLETRPCTGCRSSYPSRVRTLEGDKMGKLLWVCSDIVRPVYPPP